MSFPFPGVTLGRVAESGLEPPGPGAGAQSPKPAPAAAEIPGEPTAGETSARLNLSRAPAPLHEWVGRETLLENLNRDWLDSHRLITVLMGFGGEGKSSLARHWLEKLLHSDLPQPEGVFWWGFYERRNVDEFFGALLKYLLPHIDPNQLPSSDAKLQAINAAFKNRRYLFVLDGLEVLQQRRGDDGLLASIELRNWLRNFAAGGHPSFCLITSRAPVLELADFTTHTHREVARLSDREGLALLRNLQVRGEEADLLHLVQQWEGYALVLSLLGSYLLDHCSGDVRQLPFDLVPAEEEKQDQVSRVLRHYDKRLTETEQAFLQIFSAFRLPVPEAALPQVFGMLLDSPGSADSLQPEESFTEAVAQRLVAYRILRHNAQERHYTLHPLIRSHYLHRLHRATDRASACHRRIADFYLSTVREIPKNPLLEDLIPLIEAVHHLCQAGAYDEANHLREERIYQRNRFILTRELGAYETALGLMESFFPNGDLSRDPQVSDPGYKRYILNSMGFYLMNLGRLAEAFPFYERRNVLALEQKDWINASIGYQHLAELYAYSGDLAASLDAAREALALARRAQARQDQCSALAYQGWTAHLQGDLAGARAAFQQAETLEREIDSNSRYLYSLRGIRHADHLRRAGEADYARQITEENLKICQRNHWPDDLSLSHRVLGDLDADAQQHAGARQHYQEALKLARSISHRPVLMGVLLARGRWAVRQGDLATARNDLEEALHHAVSSGCRLYEADARVGLAWLHLQAGQRPAAQAEAGRALQISEETGYHWGRVDAEEVLSAAEEPGAD